MALYVCKCGGRNRYCTTCWGERYYTPKVTKKKEKAVPAQRAGPPEELGAPVPATDTDETEPTDACT